MKRKGEKKRKSEVCTNRQPKIVFLDARFKTPDMASTRELELQTEGKDLFELAKRKALK